jgi:hypothetical protein
MSYIGEDDDFHFTIQTLPSYKFKIIVDKSFFERGPYKLYELLQTVILKRIELVDI